MKEIFEAALVLIKGLVAGILVLIGFILLIGEIDLPLIPFILSKVAGGLIIVVTALFDKYTDKLLKV